MDITDAAEEERSNKNSSNPINNQHFVRSSCNLNQVWLIVDFLWTTQFHWAPKRLLASYGYNGCCEKDGPSKDSVNTSNNPLFVSETLKLHLHRLIVDKIRNTSPIFAQTVFLGSSWYISNCRKEFRIMLWKQHKLWASFGDPKLETPLLPLAGKLKTSATNFSPSFYIDRLKRTTNSEWLAWIWSSCSASIQNTCCRLTIFFCRSVVLLSKRSDVFG